MRNAMICVSVMLAVFLGWPLAFGGGDSNRWETSAVAAKPAAAAVVAAVAKPGPAPAPAVTSPAGQPESCYHRYQREVKQCSGQNSAACRLKTADHWDMCEATGFWPE